MENQKGFPMKKRKKIEKLLESMRMELRMIHRELKFQKEHLKWIQRNTEELQRIERKRGYCL